MMQERLFEHAWLHHYEVVVRRHGRDQSVARVPTRWQAEHKIAQVQKNIEVSRATVYLRRVRGMHPMNLAKCWLALLLVVQLLPWLWPRLVLTLLCVALIFGTVSSGKSWKQGGEDDR